MPNERARARGYAVCATQRSGSNYLCQLLTSTGALGVPLDYFNAAGRREKGWHDYPDAVERQLELVLLTGATANGVYGFKAFPEHLDALEAAQWTERLPNLRWVYLRRADVLGQAISLVIAAQTGRWRSTATAAAAPVYDAGAIRAAMEQLASDDARWRAYFARNGIEPLELEYETVAADPGAAARAVAALMELGGAVTADPAQVDVEVQRDDVNRAWRERFLAGSQSVRAPRAPRLTVSIITRNSESRLPRLLAEAASYADQIVVGVDASSTDGTLAAAAAGADVVYRFRLQRPGQLAPARMLPFDYATGDWILSLDDDESMEESFDALAPELMRAPGVTHYWFPRKWLVNDGPWEYLDAPPWFPNWAPRLFRNDRSLVWKPSRAHSMYHVLGPGSYESRTSILHYEPLWCAPAERDAKLASYRIAGASADSESFYAIPSQAPRRAVRPRPPAVPARRAGAAVHEQIRELVTAEQPPWRAAITHAVLPPSVRARERVAVRVTARNTGTLAWSPTYTQWPAKEWPMLRLSYHLFDAGGAQLSEGDRTLLPRFVAPGESVTFIAEFTAPAKPGDYVVRWDMLSENECWFEECRGTVYCSRLSVVPAVPPREATRPRAWRRVWQVLRPQT